MPRYATHHATRRAAPRAHHAPVALSALLALASALAPLSLAAQTTTTTAPAELAPVVVSASRNETRVEDMPLHTTVVTQEEIRRSPAQTLDQLLRTIPGFNFSGVPAHQSDPTGHQTRMRGLGNAKALILLDGVPIHDPFYLTTQFFKIPLFSVERIEIIRGGNSSLWGNMAVAGVVNVVTRRDIDDAGEVLVSAGSFGTTNVAASKNFRVSERLGFNLGFDQFHTDGYQQVPADARFRFPGRQPTDAKNTNVRLAGFWRPGPATSAFVRVGWHVQDQEIGYQFGRNLQQSPDLAAGLGHSFGALGRIDASVWAQNVTFSKYNGAACYWQTSGTACPTSANVTLAQVNDRIVQYYTQYGFQQYSERGTWLAWSKPLGGLVSSVQLGADYRRLKARDDERFFSAPVSLAAIQNFNSATLGEATQTFQGFFGQAKLVPVAPVEITLSARYDSWRNADRIVTRTTAAGVTTGGSVPEGEKTAVNPSVAARWDVADGAALRGAAYKSFRAPGFNNMIRTFGTGTATTIANPDLEPETLRGWELGTDLANGPFSLGATYFVYNIEDMIATYTVNANAANIPAQVNRICGPVTGGGFSSCGGATSVRFYTNDQDGQSRGWEMVGRWRASRAVTVEATYVRTDTVLTRRGSIVTDPLGVQLVAVPKDVASLGVQWLVTERIRTFGEMRYVGRMFYDTTSVASTYFSQGGFTVFNASAAWSVTKAIELFGSVINLGNKQYSENAYTFNQPFNRTLSLPRALNAGVRVRF